MAIRKRNWLYLLVTALLVMLYWVYPTDYYARYTMFIVGAGIFALAIVLTNISRIAAVIVKVVTIALALVVIFTNFTLCTYDTHTAVKQLEHFLSTGSKRGIVWPAPAFTFIENRMKPGQTVDYDSHPMAIYPLWNADFSNRVIYIPAKTKQSWISKLHSDHVQYVFADRGTNEDMWSQGSETLIYRDASYDIYQVR